MTANQPYYVPCSNGFFMLPDSVFASLSAQASKGFVYVRQDEDSMLIATTRITDGRRRAVNNHYRAPMFRDATRLAIVDMNDGLRVTAVEWK
jgi:hypothetical protein